MTPEQITRNLYTWLTDASRITDLPMGFRPATWAQLQETDSKLAQAWRDGVQAFLDTIGAGAQQDGDPHLNFIGALVLEEAPLAAEDDPGDEHRITPDGG